MIQQQQWGNNFYQYSSAPVAPQMDAASIAAALMAAQQFAPQQQQSNTNCNKHIQRQTFNKDILPKFNQVSMSQAVQ